MSREVHIVSAMEAVIVPLHSAVRLEGDRIIVERLSLSDPTLAAFLGERPAGIGVRSWSVRCASDSSRCRTPA